MGYIGEEGRVVSSFYLFNMLQDLYTKIKGLLGNKADKDHTHNYAGSASSGGSAASADKLTTARTIQTNLESTTSSAFDGGSNITPGVTGVLPVANGGTGSTTAACALTNLGITATANELNYVDGVTSNIQTQLNDKVANSKLTEINEKIEFTKNQILDPDNYVTTSAENSVVIVNFEPGSISNSTGEDREEEGYLRTPFIPIENNKFTLYTDMSISSSIRTFVYDNDMNWISTANEVGFYRINNGEKAEITSEAKYIKCRVGTTDTSGTLTVTFDANPVIHQKIYFNNGYNMESTLIEDNLYQLQVNAEEDEFNIFTIAAPKNNASEATLALMLDDEKKTQFVDLSCMKYNENENGTFSTILQSRGGTPLPSYVLGFNDGKGAGRVRKLEIAPDAIPMQFTSDGIRVRKDNTYDNNWTDDNSVVVNLVELATKNANASDGCYTIKGTITTLFTPTEEGTWYVSDGDDTFPYPYGLLEIRYGSYPEEYTVTYKTSGDDFKLYYNGWREASGGWIGWKDCVECDNADTVDGYHADAFQKNISIHSKIDLKSGSFYDCILGKINEGFRGGKIEINDYCPSDTCNGNYWGFVEWTCNENRFAHLVFYTDRWEIIYVREISFNEETDTGWKRIGEGCNADTLDGYHADSFAKLSGAYFSGNVTIHSGDLNGKYNGLLVGDDCYIGDCNIGNTIGLMGVSDNNIAYVKFGKNGKQLGFNGSNLVYDGSVVVTENTGTSLSTKGLKSTGFGNTNFTYYQTDQEFDGRSGWAHYLIGNHGDGASYYHYNVALPFWDTPMYKRQWDGGNSGWQKFHTTETITYGTSTLTPGLSSLSTGHIYLQYE